MDRRAASVAVQPAPAGGLVGPWRLEDPLGPGTFAGIEAATGGGVVVKVAAAGTPEAARLRHEAVALRSLGGSGSPALAAAAGDLDDGSVVAVATVRVDGLPLDQVLAGGPLRPGDAARTLAPVADALAAIHAAGWVHGDLSPANVVVGEEGGVLVDLGAAHPDGAPLPPEAHPATAAPEVRGGGPTTAAADVWSLAAVVAVAVTGAPPTAGAPLPAPVALALRRALAEEPAARPTAAELARALHALGRDGEVRSAPPDARVLPRAERVTRDLAPRPVRVPAATPLAPQPRRPVLVAAVGLATAAIAWRLGYGTWPWPGL